MPGAAWSQTPVAAGATAPADWSQQLRGFARSLHSDIDIPGDWALEVLSQAKYNQHVIRLMTPVPGRKTTVPDWQVYRDRLISNSRIEAGVQFWDRYRSVLGDVQQRTGVPASVIVGIIGIESSYGRNTGNIRVLDALATLAFDYPATHARAQEREAYFRRELVEFLRLCLSSGLDPLTVTGSYAGALGIPQFMPSSWLRYGQDYNHDGVVNLINTPEDAILSVANYLKEHGWQRDQPSYFPVALNASPEQLEQLRKPSVLPTFDAARMADLGVALPSEARHYGGTMALIELRNGDNRPPEFYAGTRNFYAVTRYNQSSYYAMAVLQLGEAVQRRAQEQAGSGARGR